MKFFLCPGSVWPWLALVLVLGAGSQAQDSTPTFRVLTYNTWGIFNSKERPFRMEKLPEAIAALNPDAVCLEECFRNQDLHTIENGLRQRGYPVETIYQKELYYGSGVVLISRYPAETIEFEPYLIKAAPYSYEREAGRGIAHARLQTPSGPVEFFCTHSMPRMNKIFDAQGNYLDGDRKQSDRLLQMVEVSQMVERMRDPGAASVIVSGDFNVSPEMLEYQLLLAADGFRSSFSALHPAENPSSYTKAGNEFATVEASRLDHILFRNYPGEVGRRLQPVESRVAMKELYDDPKLGRAIPLSDHFGMFTVFAQKAPAELSADPAPPAARDRKPADFYRAAIASGMIELTAENRPAWQSLARAVLEDLIARGRRNDPLIRPASEILAGWSAQDGKQQVHLDPRRQKLFENFLNRSNPDR